MDSATIAALSMGVVAVTGIILKFVHSLRNDIKDCFCIHFRTPVATPLQTSPRNSAQVLSQQQLLDLQNMSAQLVHVLPNHQNSFMFPPPTPNTQPSPLQSQPNLQTF